MPSLAFSRPEQLLTTLSLDADTFLKTVWENVGKDLNRKERLAAHGLACEVLTTEVGSVALIQLPETEGEAEAHFLAVVFTVPDAPTPDTTRVFTLEKAWSLISKIEYNVLGEWTRDEHLNFGEGPATDRGAFVAKVVEVVSEQPN